MKSLPLSPLAPLAALALSACSISWSFSGVEGSGIRAEEIREVPEFASIALRAAVDVTVEVGSPASITIAGDDNLVPLLETEVRGNELVIRSDQNLAPRVGLSVRVTTPELGAFSISGSGDVEIEGLEREHFEAAISGSGTLEARGRVDRLEATISGSGDMRLGELSAREAEARISGSGDMELHVEELLEYSVSGSGDIRYRGAARVEGKVAGSGSIRHRED